MKNTIARYFSVDEGIRDSRGESRYRSIFVKNFREKNGEKQKILQSWKIIKLLNYQIQQKKVIEIFQVGDNLKQRIKDDTNWKMIQIIRKSRIKSERRNLENTVYWNFSRDWPFRRRIRSLPCKGVAMIFWNRVAVHARSFA